MTYTYDDFEKEAQGSGLLNQFSAADLSLAKTNPDAAMTLLSAKKDYSAATTDDQRALANAAANDIRQKFGGFTGGSTGRDYTRTFDSLAAPQSSGYTSPYKQQSDKLISNIQNRSFSYDADTDPAAQAYTKQYVREGERATKNALGEVAAATGGIPSTFATTAASQAGQYYGAQLADKTTELEENAYNKYLQENNIDLQILDALNGLESTGYNEYSNDRSFDYSKILNDLENKKTESATSKTDLENQAALLASAGDFSGYKKLYPDLTAAQLQALTKAFAAKKTSTSGKVSAYSYGTGKTGGVDNDGNDGGGTTDTVASFDQARGEVYSLMSQGMNKDDVLNQIQQAYEAKQISKADLQKYKSAVSSVRA